MLKNIIENYVRKTKNKNFRFDEAIDSSVLFSFTLEKIFALLRGFRFLDSYHFKKKIFLGKNVKIFNKKNIRLGNNVNIGDYVKLYSLGRKKLVLGNNVNIGSFSQIMTSISLDNIGEFIEIGDNVGIGEFAHIGGAGGVTIGKDTIVGQYLSLHPENHNYSDPNLLIREQGVTRKGINIGENCWLGSKVTILDGVTIGSGCVIAAGSVVTKSFPDNVIIGGVPAKIIKDRI